MLMDTIKKDPKAEAIEVLKDAGDTIYELWGIINVLRDVVASHDGGPEGVTIGAETQVGVAAIVKLVNERYSGVLPRILEARHGLQGATHGSKKAAW